MSPASSLTERFPDFPLAAKSIVGFWLFYYLTIVARALLLGDPHATIDWRALSIVLGILLTFAVWLVLRRTNGKPMRARAIVAALACIPASALFASFSLYFVIYQPLVATRNVITERGPDGTVMKRLPNGEFRIEREDGPPTIVQMPPITQILRERAPQMLADSMATWYFFFAGWAGLYIALSSAEQLRTAERRAARFEREAQSAQLRALRYQINPHFLFNTLNSLSSLIMARRAEESETMIVNLSTFFRTTLAIDPTEDVTLSQEIALQMLYLDIEKVRFPQRLKVVVDIPEALGDAKVPALLLQPVIENSIKYGVSRSRGVVTLTIRAEELGARLRLTIENDGAGDPRGAAGSGTGVGLTNVCERLAARFGASASCSYGAEPDGGFKVTIMMPVIRDA